MGDPHIYICSSELGPLVVLASTYPVLFALSTNNFSTTDTRSIPTQPETLDGVTVINLHKIKPDGNPSNGTDRVNLRAKLLSWGFEAGVERTSFSMFLTRSV